MYRNFSSKAQTLDFVKRKLSIFNVPDLLYFKILSYKKAPSGIIEEIRDRFKCDKIIIRSSASDEDGDSTAAGEYDSILNVSSQDENEISAAIQSVIDSIEKKRSCNAKDEFIAQKMIEKPNMSGVLFTYDLNTGAPYYVINYDDKSGQTDTVTSGRSEYSNRTLYIHRGSSDLLRSDRFSNLIKATAELEKILKNEYLDIEFAIDDDFKPHLFQVRKITTHSKWNKYISKNIDDALREIKSVVKSRFKPIADAYGNTTVLGQMPDWNPVEMIGRAPRALAFSLYKGFITDSAWRIARSKMKYSVPRNQPLMISLAGQPYIDTRLSFHSYLPNTLSPTISEKLVNHWVDSLKEKPALHDKIEFDVAITSYSFDIDEKIEKLIGDEISDQEKTILKEAYREHTKNLLIGEGEFSIKSALNKLKMLSLKQSEYSKNFNKRDFSYIKEIIDECVKYGTVPFSILARHGFIAKTILLSLKNLKILSLGDIDNIESSIKTIASEFVNDMHSLQHKKLSLADFMDKYGHLRPGTYDILSNRYDKMSNIVNSKIEQKVSVSEEFRLSNKQKQEINSLLKEHDFSNLDANKLMIYIEEATMGREYGKFIFTRSVSDILEIISDYAENFGLTREEISHVSINDILEAGRENKFKLVSNSLKKISKENSDKHILSSAIRLPQILFDEEGVSIIPFQVSAPNFITNKKISAQTEFLSSRMDIETNSLRNKIVLIEGADPGFDWIFSQNIAGLITKYGGANSHMAIRSAEFEIPAAIGCGEQRFESVFQSNRVLLDCAAGLIKTIN